MPKSTHWSTCTAQKESGEFCDAPSMPDVPFPICFRHAAQIYRFLRGAIDGASQSDNSLEIISDMFEERNKRVLAEAALQQGLVYYVQIGEHVKIGFTTNLRGRLAQYPPNRRLLATEPGFEDVERQRHAEFSQYRYMGREWFEPGPDLLAHINRLRLAERARPIVKLTKL